MMKITKAKIKDRAMLWLVYGMPGVGKTSLMADFPNALLLDFEDGNFRSEVLIKAGVDIVEAESLAKSSVEDLIALGQTDYKTIFVDTLPAFMKILAVLVIGRAPANIRDWGILKTAATDIFIQWKLNNKDFIFLSHSQRSGSKEIEWPNLGQGNAGEELLSSMDFIGRMYKKGKGLRFIDFSSDGEAVGKDSLGIGTVNLQESNLYEVLQSCHSKLAAIGPFRESLEAAQNCDQINALLTTAKALGYEAKKALNHRAKELGLVYSDDVECYGPALEKALL